METKHNLGKYRDFNLNLTIFIFFLLQHTVKKRRRVPWKNKIRKRRVVYPNFSVICYCCVRRTRKQIKVCSDGMKTFLLILLKDGFFQGLFSFRYRNNVLHWWKKLILGVSVFQQWKGAKKSHNFNCIQSNQVTKLWLLLSHRIWKNIFSNFFNCMHINQWI